MAKLLKDNNFELENYVNPIPSFNASDANKKLSVNSAGNGIEWQEGGGGSLYRHNIRIRATSTSSQIGGFYSLYSSSSEPINTIELLFNNIGSFPIVLASDGIIHVHCFVFSVNYTRYSFVDYDGSVINGTISSVSDTVTQV